jgi:hypothetical protein
MGEMRCPSTGSVGMPEGKKPLGSPRYRWEDNFKMELTVLEWELGLKWLRIKTDGDLLSKRNFGFP